MPLPRKKMPTQSVQSAGSLQKEISPSRRQERLVEERPVLPEIAPKIEKYVAPIEKEIQLPQPVTDKGGAPLVSPISPQQVAISLSLDSQKFAVGLKAKLSSSWRWLSERAKRLLKKTAGRFVYRLR